MKFTDTHKLKTSANCHAVIKVVAEVFTPLAAQIEQRNQVVQVKGIQQTFGSALRQDVTRFTLKPKTNGYLIVADTEFKPTWWFWFCFIISIGTILGPIIDVCLYFYQKHLVQREIKDGLKRIVEEVEDAVDESAMRPSGGAGDSQDADRVDRLAGLLEVGLIDELEFDAAKKKGFGIGPTPTLNQTDLFLEDDADPMIYVKRKGVVQKPYLRSLLVKNHAKLLPADEFGQSPNGPWLLRDKFFP